MVSALRRKLAALRLAIEEGVFCLCLVARVHSRAIRRLAKKSRRRAASETGLRCCSSICYAHRAILQHV